VRAPTQLARAARALPVVGRSAAARRKIIARAVRIARLPPEVKKAAKNTGLDNNQRALLKIARTKGRKAQLRRIKDLAGRLQNLNSLPKQTGKATASSRDGLQGKTNGSVQGPSLKSDPDNGDKSEANYETTETSKKRTTTFDELETFWDRDGRELWAYAPFDDRERFIEKLRRAKCKAQVDVVAFLRDVFRGRYEVKKRELYALAKTRGLAKRSVRKTLSELGYPPKRKGDGSSAVWYFRNKDHEWKEQLRTISDAELSAARAINPNRTVRQPVKWCDGESKARDDYFSTI
jgi:hypothetical protein